MGLHTCLHAFLCFLFRHRAQKHGSPRHDTDDSVQKCSTQGHTHGHREQDTDTSPNTELLYIMPANFAKKIQITKREKEKDRKDKLLCQQYISLPHDHKPRTHSACCGINMLTALHTSGL
jgi:hypothetical protein